MDFSKYDKRKLLLLLIFSLLAVQTVAAQNLADMLGNIPAFEGLTAGRVEELYDDFWWLWDAIVYTIILGVGLRFGASQSKVFGEKGGMVATVIALVLAISAVFAENQFDFNLKKFAPLALAIALFALAYYLWNMIKGMNLGKGSRIVFALLFLGIYGLTSDFLKGLREMAGSYLTWIPTIMDILAAVFVIMLLFEIWNLIRGAWKSGGGGGGGVKGLFGGGVNARTEEEEKAHKKAEQIGEAEAGQIANVEQYETRLDEYARSLGKAEIKDEQQFKQELQKAIQLAEEAEKVEMEMENIMQQVQAGQYGDKTRKQVDDLRKKYADHVERVFKRVQAADKFARMERQQLLAELKELLAASQADQRVHGIVGNLSMTLGNDRARFIRDHNLTGQVKADIEKLDVAIREFQQLEQQKAQVLRPAEQELKRLEDATNIEINDLDKVMAEMRSLAKLGQLRRPQLNAIISQLRNLLQVGSAKQHGIQQAQDIIVKVRNTDKRLKEVAALFRRLEADVLGKLGKGAGGRSKQALTAINKLKI